jgi:hypothetical protein
MSPRHRHLLRLPAPLRFAGSTFGRSPLTSRVASNSDNDFCRPQLGYTAKPGSVLPG